MLKNNKVLTNIYIYCDNYKYIANNRVGYKLIIDALEENSTVLTFINFSVCTYEDKIKKYCDRNKHNKRLKSMSLVDVDYVRKVSKCCVC
jgi:Fic family protein